MDGEYHPARIDPEAKTHAEQDHGYAFLIGYMFAGILFAVCVITGIIVCLFIHGGKRCLTT